MYVRVKKSVTAGTAVLAAGAIALGPVVSQAPEAQRAMRAADLALSAAANPIEAAAFIVEGFGTSGVRLVQGALTAPLGLIPLVEALGAQDSEALYSVLREYNDAPLWVADPTIDGFAEALPRWLGGGTDGDRYVNSSEDGAIIDFRDNVLWVATDNARTQINNALHVDAGPPANLFEGAVTLSVGAGGTAVRLVEGAALAPFGLIPVAQGLATSATTGDNTALYVAVRQYIDAPLWVADPAIDSVAKVLPRSLGGGTDGNHNVSSDLDGAVVKFRDNALWGATNAVRTAVADVLNVNPNAGNVPAAPLAASPKKANVAGSVNLGKFLPGASAPEGATKTRPGRAAVGALRNQVRASVAKVNADINAAVKKVTSGLPAKKAAAKEKTAATSEKAAEGSED